MSETDKEVALFQPTDASSDALLRECSATAMALNQVFGLPPIVERLDTQFSLTLVGRADRLFKLEDGSLWHLEWQGAGDNEMFKRMMDYWVFARNNVDPVARIRSTVVLVGKAPRKWTIEDWVGDERITFPVVDFRTLDVSRLFNEGNASDMLLGVLGLDGTRSDRLRRTLETITANPPPERDRLLSMLGRMIELKGGAVELPPGVQDMIDAIEIDYERNPIFRTSYEAGAKIGAMVERRQNALRMLCIAMPDRDDENRRLVDTLPDGKLDALIAAVTNLLTVKSRQAQEELEEVIGAKPV